MLHIPNMYMQYKYNLSNFFAYFQVDDSDLIQNLLASGKPLGTSKLYNDEIATQKRYCRKPIKKFIIYTFSSSYSYLS